MKIEHLFQFLHRRNRRAFRCTPAVSLFSGVGLSDLGYELAGFEFIVQCELDQRLAEIGKRNFSSSQWIVGDIREKHNQIVKTFITHSHNRQLELLSLTPPCQGMSSSNPGRGKISSHEQSDQRNTLILDTLPIIEALKPRIVVAENVAPLLNRVVKWQGQIRTVVQAFADSLDSYHIFAGVVEMADYGVPQKRKRSILVAIRDDEPVLPQLKNKKLLPWPRPTHSEYPTREKNKWVNVREWFETMKYPTLDARTNPTDPNLPLHFVTNYPEGDRRYTLLSSIPPNSGRNAYANDTCPTCKKNSIPFHNSYCPHCGEVLFNRPITLKRNGKWRLVKGFNSSYKRMASDQPASTVTTNSSHLGSDNKIHPWEHRVLSALECADLQTIPRFYDWTWALETRRCYIIRKAIGEALPPFLYFPARPNIDANA